MVSGATTGFLYDGVNPVQDLVGTTPTVNLLTGLGLDEIFARTDAAGARHFLPDALGSTVGLTDAGGAILTQYTYEPFGTTTVSGSTSVNPYQYTGRENDRAGLYYYRTRYYHSTFQRFASEDPISLEGGVNLYAYAGNDPIDFGDPLGLKPKRRSRPGRPLQQPPPPPPPEEPKKPPQPPAPKRPPDKPPCRAGGPKDPGPGGINDFLEHWDQAIEEPLMHIFAPVALIGGGIALGGSYIAGIPEVCATGVGCFVYLIHAPVILGGSGTLIYGGYVAFKEYTVPYFGSGGYR